MWQSMWPLLVLFFFLKSHGGHGWYIAWLIFFFNCPFLERMAIDTGIIRAHLRLIPYFISLKKRMAAEYSCEVLFRMRNHLYLAFPRLRWVWPSSTSDWSAINNRALLVTTIAAMQHAAERLLGGIMKVKRSEAELNPSTARLECYWRLGEIAYYPEKSTWEISNAHWQKSFAVLLLCAGGQQPFKDRSPHICSSGPFEFFWSLQNRISQNNTWKRQKIQSKVRS